jgi:hypothetical protein
VRAVDARWGIGLFRSKRFYRFSRSLAGALDWTRPTDSIYTYVLWWPSARRTVCRHEKLLLPAATAGCAVTQVASLSLLSMGGCDGVLALRECDRARVKSVGLAGRFAVMGEATAATRPAPGLRSHAPYWALECMLSLPVCGARYHPHLTFRIDGLFP